MVHVNDLEIGTNARPIVDLPWPAAMRARPAAGLAAALRVVLVAYSTWHDEAAQLAYSDIDYLVVSDGAALVSAGRSPFDRPTYRNSPLLALTLLPTVWLHPSFGKLLFCAADMCVGALLHAILCARGVPARLADRCTAAWLFNPVAIAISTRGSHDALITVPVLGALLMHCRGRLIPAAGLLAAAAHLKLYPVIFLPAFLVSIDQHFPPGLSAQAAAPPELGRSHSLRDAVARLQQSRSPTGFEPLSHANVFWLRARFTLAFGVAYAVLLAACTAWCGRPYLREGLLYHFSRTDARHNFSPFFYPTLLAMSGGRSAADASPLAAAMLGHALAFGPLLVLGGILLLLAMKLGSDLPFCMLVQATAFVALNKVCTAQYFVWFLSLLPLALPSTLATGERHRLPAVALLCGWAGSCGIWLWLAYRLEYAGTGRYLQVWLGSLCFLIANGALLCGMVRWHVPTPLFRRGRLAAQACVLGAPNREANVQLVRERFARSTRARQPEHLAVPGDVGKEDGIGASSSGGAGDPERRWMPSGERTVEETGTGMSCRDSAMAPIVRRRAVLAQAMLCL
jgi:phosphatidylinositol glycan class M